MNALELIKSDHERMRALLEEALDAREPQDRVEMLHSIRTELTAHEQMEEEVFYPALRAHGEAAQAVLESLEAHQVVEMLLDDLLDLPEESDEWHARLKELQEAAEQHMAEEEEKVFAKAREVFSAEELDQLGVRMEETKAAA